MVVPRKQAPHSMWDLPGPGLEPLELTADSLGTSHSEIG